MEPNNVSKLHNQNRKSKMLVVLLVICLVTMATGLAQAEMEIQAQRDSCEDGGVGGCFDDMLDQQDSMITGIDELLDTMDDAGLFSIIRIQTSADAKSDLKERIETLRREHGRGRDVNAATSDEEYDNMLAQGDKEKVRGSCKLSDINYYNSLKDEDDPFLPPGYMWVDTGNGKNKFGNNKCDVFEAKDLNGNLVMVNERTENMCEEICKEKAGQGGQSKGRFLANLDDAISTSRTANLMISAQIARVNELGILLSELQLTEINPANDDVCDVSSGDELGKLNAEEVLQIIITAFDGLVVVTDIIVQITEFAKDIAEKPCGQTVAGFNANTACTPAVFVYHIANGANDILKNAITITGDAKELVALAAEKYEAQDSLDAKACTKEIRDEFIGTGKIVLLQEDVDTLDTKVNALVTAAGDTNAMLLEVKEALRLMNIIIETNQDLLLTPPGQRDNFNK